MLANPFLDCWFLTGATASGKTRLGIELAQRLDAEIISLDSMAIYRGMDIGTAKPAAQERQAVAHHLIDIVDPSEEYSLSQYVEDARAAVENLRFGGKRALFVGGTPLYLKALLRGIFAGPPADWELRRRLEAETREDGGSGLRVRLAKIDPQIVQKVHANDVRRMIRAWEVYEATGQPISELQRQFDTPVPREACRVFRLDWPRPKLHARINRRVDEMFDAGLVCETRELLQRGPLSRTAAQAVGYREVIAHLRGEYDLPRAIELVKIRTRQFAKRQCTWFRSLSECRPLDMTQAVDVDQLSGI